MLNLSPEQKTEVIKDLEVFCALGRETEKKLIDAVFTISKTIAVDNFGTPLDKQAALNNLTSQLEQFENSIEAAAAIKELFINKL